MSGTAIILSLIGLVIGLLISQDRELMGVALGGLTGFLLGSHLHMRHQLTLIMRQLQRDKREPTPVKPAKGTIEQKAATETVTPPTTTVAKPAKVTVPQVVEAVSRKAEPETNKEPMSDQAGSLGKYIRDFFTDGNAVVRIGLLVLLFGVGFLIKYVSERSLVPIEVRLAGIFIAAIAMLYFGRRVAHKSKRRTFGLLIIGGSIGIMYLTIFASARLYDVLPLGMAMIALIVLTLFGALLAITEDAKGLAIISIAGAFLAPILTSTDSGNHVALFSYYALINLGIIIIAWFKAWRELNLEGYLFTFIIGSLWGYQSYIPEHFATTEPFLILFFVMFVLISVLFAHKRAPSFRDYVDSTLVFGVPLAAFVLQSFMVIEMEYGMALSALGMSIFYVMTALILWRRQQEHLRLLTESFLSLGVAFATLAIPFAVDGQITAATWALEGAGIVWIGCRQHKTIQWLSGSGLQIAAAYIFFHELGYDANTLIYLNAEYLGSLLIASAAIFSAYNLDRHQQELRWVSDIKLPLLFLIWGLLWLYVSGIDQVDDHGGVWLADKSRTILVYITLATLALHVLSRKLEWGMGGKAVHGFMPLMLIFGLILPFANNDMPLVSQLGFIAFPFAIICYFLFLKQREADMSLLMRSAWHMFGTWWLYILITFDLFWFITNKLPINDAWGYILWGIMPPILALWVFRISRGSSWPVAVNREIYLTKVISPLMLFSWYWVITSSSIAGSSEPLPFITLFNPIELATSFILLVGIYWIFRMHQEGLTKGIFLSRRNLTMALGITAFVWLNAVIGRAIHHYVGIPHNMDALFNSLEFQMSVSVVWSMVAVAMAYIAHRIHERYLWISGMGLLVLVVLKLFFIDLANSGTIERIISFITVGLLMLVVGYIAPLPPAKKETQHA